MAVRSDPAATVNVPLDANHIAVNPPARLTGTPFVYVIVAAPYPICALTHREQTLLSSMVPVRQVTLQPVAVVPELTYVLYELPLVQLEQAVIAPPVL